jgi:hypothetical protein
MIELFNGLMSLITVIAVLSTGVQSIVVVGAVWIILLFVFDIIETMSN